MEKEFIPYELAITLNELGFDEPCMRGWYKDGGIWYHPDSDIILDNPTFSQAFRWFREKYKFDLTIQHNKKYVAIVYSSLKNFSIDEYETYEIAELESLKKLIEIVKNK